LKTAFTSPTSKSCERVEALLKETVVVADLDGTLVHSARRCPDPTGMGVVERYDNRDVGFVTAACWHALAKLQAIAELIPVTARVRRQYDRVAFPSPPRIAAIEAGARILVGGRPNRHWDVRSAGIVAATGVTMGDVVERMGHLDLTEPARTGDVALVYARIATANGLPEFESWCARYRWSVVAQDGRIYVLPEGIGKAAAAVHAATLASGVIIVAVGDGLMDEAMLRNSPTAFTPEGGQLWRAGHRFATPIAGHGPLTAENIVLESINAVERHRNRSCT